MNNALHNFFTLFPDRVYIFKDYANKRLTAARPRTYAGLAKLVSNFNNRNYHVFASLNPCLPEIVRKPSLADTIEVQYFVIDLDPAPGFPAVSSYWIEDFSNVRAYRPIEVSTGRGAQLWFPALQGNLSVMQAHYAIKEFTRRFIDDYATRLRESNAVVDTACADASRIVRVPGTLNPKSNIICDWRSNPAEMHLGTPVSLEHFFSSDLMPVEEHHLTPLTDTDLFHLLPALKPINADFLQHGSLTQRHERLYGLTKNLHELGIPRGRAASLVEQAAARTRPSLLKDDPTVVIQQLRQVYGSVS